MMRVLSVIHGPRVRSELFADVVQDGGHELLEWDIRLQGRPPHDFDAVLVFGGDQNVGEEFEYPWLHTEYEALQGWAAAGTPLLGVCLGAQTLAHALGAAVERLPQPQLGWVGTELTVAGAEDPVVGELPGRFQALNANGYTFAVPPGGVELARADSLSQAFRARERAWGVQFHPEVRLEQVLEWFEQARDLPVAFEQLSQEIEAGIAEWQDLGRRLARAFLAAAE